jgi:hypothetical protein
MFGGSTPSATVNCQDLSNGKLSWPDHQGLASVADWAAFNYQHCTTLPTAYTSNLILFSNYYSNLGPAPPKKDPALTENQKMESGSTTYYVGNPVSNKELSLTPDGVLSLKNSTTGAKDWSTPSAGLNGAVLKFDSNAYNSGNLCIFPKTGTDPPPVWCMLQRISVPTTACSRTGGGAACPPGSYSGTDLASYQNSLFNTAKLKNTTDTAARFVMIDDAGKFCMYKGSPGAIQGTSIICK